MSCLDPPKYCGEAGWRCEGLGGVECIVLCCWPSRASILSATHVYLLVWCAVWCACASRLSGCLVCDCVHGCVHHSCLCYPPAAPRPPACARAAVRACQSAACQAKKATWWCVLRWLSHAPCQQRKRSSCALCCPDWLGIPLAVLLQRCCEPRQVLQRC